MRPRRQMEFPTLPPRARLLHVGLMKSGTTALQSAADRHRETLLRHGVRYPGRDYNHRVAAEALVGRTSSSRRRDAWDRLIAEVSRDRDSRILISSELLAVGGDDMARRCRADLGSRIADLADLGRRPRTDGAWRVSELVPVEVAAQAVVGAVSAGLGRGSGFGSPRGRSSRVVEGVIERARALVSALGLRLRPGGPRGSCGRD